MRVGSLFTGLGGLELGLPPHDLVWACEFDKHCRKVLSTRFPGVTLHADVREIGQGLEPLEPVDMLVGGYPCQPFSYAGKLKGENDPRHLWPEFARLIRLLRPRYALLENVAGHLRLGFDSVLRDLAEAGFDAEWVVVRASDIGAPHRRERLFCLATNTEEHGSQGAAATNVARLEGREQFAASDGAAADAERERLHGGGERDETRPSEEWGDGRGQPQGSSQAAADADQDGFGGITQLDGPPATGLDRECRGHAHGRGVEAARDAGLGADQWGVYEPAVRRWEDILGRPAPGPTDDRGRLNPPFVEWMMGLPAGWVTDPDLGVSRTQQLRMLGNAVVPQQAALALSILNG